MIGTVEGFANPIPFTEEEKTVSVRGPVVTMSA